MAARRPSQNRGRQSYGSPYSAPAPLPRPAIQPPAVYGPAFVLLEDAQKNTFEYVGGAWQPHARSIAEYRVGSKVAQLAQKVNNMTRYEVRSRLQ